MSIGQQRSSRPRRLRLGVVALAIGLAGVLAPTAAASSLSWSAPTPIDPPEGSLGQAACPSVSLCVTIDLEGNVLTTTNPTGGAAAWTKANIDGSNFLTTVGCAPSGGLCVAGDASGNVLTSSNPTGGPSAWSAPASVGSYIGSVSCPTTSFCAAVGYTGDVFTSTNPTGGASAWQSATVDSGHSMSGVACPSASLCVAVDQSGNEISSTNPTGGAAAWSAPTEIAALINEEPEPLDAISCPTISFCVAVDGYDAPHTVHPSTGDVITSTNPSGRAGAWSAPTQIAPGDNGLFYVTCASATFCLASDFSGSVYAATKPAGGAAAWTASNIDHLGNLAGLACPSELLCVATDIQGKVLTGTGTAAEKEPEPAPKEEHPTGRGSTPLPSSSPLPTIAPGGLGPAPTLTSAQLAALLSKQLAPSGKAAKISALLKHGGLTMGFHGLGAGTLTVQWFVVPPGAKLAKHAKLLLVASGKLTIAATGAGKLKLQLTMVGRRLFKHAKRLKVVARGMFIPLSGTKVSAASSLSLKQ